MTRHRAPRPWRKRLVAIGVGGVAIGLIAFGSTVLLDRHEATHRDPDQPLAAGELDETPVDIDSCEAAPDEPRIISLGSLGVEGCVVPVGVTDGQLDSPTNINVAGWFTDSAKPGEDGLSIIDGHSSGRYHDGIFSRVAEFEPGALFTVEYGDGTVRRFEVASVDSHSVDDTMTTMWSDARAHGADLALITCGGRYDASTHSYDERVVVLAVNA